MVQFRTIPKGEAAEAVILIACALFYWAVSALCVWSPLSFISIGLYCFLLRVMFQIDRISAAVVFPFMALRFQMVISLIAIETGGQMDELQRFGEPGDYVAGYLFYSIVFGLVSVFCLKLFSVKIRRDVVSGKVLGQNANISSLIVLGACAAICAYLLAFGLQTGFPLFTNTDRFVYRRFTADTIVLFALNLKFVSGILLGWIFFVNENRSLRGMSVVLFAMLTCTFFLFGDKFGTILSNALFFLVPYLVLRWSGSFKGLLKLLPVFSVFFLLASAVTYYIYSGGGALSFDVTASKLANRIAGSGQLWYIAVKNDPPLFTWDEHLVDANIAALSSDTPDYDFFLNGLGTYYFAYKYAPTSLINSMLNNAGTTSFTGGYEAIGVVMFGYLGLAGLMAITGAFLSAYSYYALYAFRTGNWISILFSYLLLTQFVYATSQGNLNVLFQYSRVKYYIFFIAFEIGMAILRSEAGMRARNRLRRGRQLSRLPSLANAPGAVFDIRNQKR